MALGFSTEGLAGRSASAPWFVIGVWALVLVAAVVAIGALLSDALTSEVRLTNNPESERADALLEEWRGEDHSEEVVIVQSEELTVDDREFQMRVDSLYQEILAIGPAAVLGGTNYFQSGDESLVSEDRRTTLLPFTMAGDQVDAEDNISKVLSVTNEADGQDGFEVLVAGNAALSHETAEIAENDLTTGEAIGIPIALMILILVFGSLTAAIIPIVLGILSIIIAIGITALLGQVFQFSFFVTNVITMMGLAVGIDYSLFIVSRFREERSRGLDKAAAIRATGSTASRAVFFSGITVVFALLGMLLVPSTIFRSLGAGAIIVVLVSVLVTMTLLPAVIGLLGDKVNSLRVPFIGKRIEQIDTEKPGGFWDRITVVVMRYPVISLVLAGGFMIALALPYLRIETGTTGVSTLPPDSESYQAFQILQTEFNYRHRRPH